MSIDVCSLLFVCSLAASGASEGPVRTLKLAQEDATFVCRPGQTARAAFHVGNNGVAPQRAELQWEVMDGAGRVLETGSAGAEVLPTAQATVAFEPGIPEPGYYDFRCRGTLGTETLGPVYGSFVRLPEKAPRNRESRFGLYKHGNSDLVAAMKPLGYYRYFRETGAYWVTSDMWWRAVQPNGPDEWNWTVLDQQFADVKEAGLQLIPHLFGIPEWATSYKEGDLTGGDGNKGAVYPPKEEAWGKWAGFVYAFVDRYKEELTYLRVWNEFDTAYWMGSYKDFARLLQIAYEEAHRAKPDIKIVIDVALAKVSVFEALCQEGGGPFFDILSIHNYQLDKQVPPEQTNLVEEYEGVRAWRDKRFPGRPVWESEICWLAEPWSMASWYGLGELAQAQYAVRGQVLALMCGMEKVIWFPYHSWAWKQGGKPYEHGGALVRHNMTPRPAFAAYANMVNLIDDATYTRRLDMPSTSVYALEFAEDSSRYVTVLWSTSTEPERVTLASDEPRLELVGMFGASQTLVPQDGVFGVTASGSPSFVVSSKPLKSADGVGVADGYKIDWSFAPAGDGTASVKIAMTRTGSQARCLLADVENAVSPDASIPCRLNLYQDRATQFTARVLVPSASQDGAVATHLRVTEQGGDSVRFPLRMPLPAVSGPAWRAGSGQTPAEYVRALAKPAQVAGVLLSLPSAVVYDVAVDARSGEQWGEAAPFAVRSGVVWIPIGKEADALRVRFRQLMADASFEPPAVVHPQGDRKKLPPLYWVNGSNRPYIETVQDSPHSGAVCVKINALDAGRGKSPGGDEFSQIEQVVPVRPNTSYTFSAFAKMPQNQDGWAAMFVFGSSPEGKPLQNNFVVLPAVDNEWRRLFLTVRSEERQTQLCVSCAMIGNGLAYFDDIMAIEGTTPTDIPEIICMDLYGTDADGQLVRLP